MCMFQKILFVVVFALSLSACGGSGSSSDSVNSDQADRDEVDNNVVDNNVVDNNAVEQMTDLDGDFYYYEADQTIRYENQEQQLIVTNNPKAANRILFLPDAQTGERQRGIIYVDHNGVTYFSYVDKGELVKTSLMIHGTVCPVEQDYSGYRSEILPSVVVEFTPNKPFKRSMVTLLVKQDNEFCGLYPIHLDNEDIAAYGEPIYKNFTASSFLSLRQNYDGNIHRLKVTDANGVVKHDLILNDVADNCDSANAYASGVSSEGHSQLLVMLVCDSVTRGWLVKEESAPRMVLETEQTGIQYLYHDDQQAFFQKNKDLYGVDYNSDKELTTYADDYEGHLVITKDFVVYRYENDYSNQSSSYTSVRRDDTSMHWDLGNVSALSTSLMYVDYDNNKLFWNVPLKINGIFIEPAHLAVFDVDSKSKTEHPFWVVDLVVDNGNPMLIGYGLKNSSSSFSGSITQENSTEHHLLSYSLSNEKLTAIGSFPDDADDVSAMFRYYRSSSAQNGRLLTDIFIFRDEPQHRLSDFNLYEAGSLEHRISVGKVYPVTEANFSPSAMAVDSYRGGWLN